jgi:hypothetical protein
MKASEIQPGPKVQIEKRHDDAFRVLYNETQKEMYIEEFGNPEVYFDTKYNVYRVPEFAESIKKYNHSKSLDCAIWGCE